jgi:excinuclease ABC subunit C
MTLDEKIKSLPAQPGCYIHKSSKGEVLYVGKAKNLSHRVRQYFQSNRPVDLKTQELIARITDFGISLPILRLRHFSSSRT